ncbi:MAG: hypothetical protein M3401_19210, partial [Actinomycetota bacterium]|nr:hypothetical protein [Actinomycetota bacterium]
IAHAQMRYARNAVFTSALNCEVPTNPASLTITDSDLAAPINLCGVVKAALLDRVAIHDVSIGIRIRGLSASFRGSFRNVNRAIEACSWGTAHCTVDAAYVDWGSSSGPFIAGEPTPVCGSITVQPWIGQADGQRPPVFAVPNCDGSATPAEQLAKAEAAAAKRRAAHASNCSLGDQAACEQLERFNKCRAAAVEIAQTRYPEDDFNVGVDAMGGAVDNAASRGLFRAASSGVETSAQVTAWAIRIFDVVDLYYALKKAVDRCV